MNDIEDKIDDHIIDQLNMVTTMMDDTMVDLDTTHSRILQLQSITNLESNPVIARLFNELLEEITSLMQDVETFNSDLDINHPIKIEHKLE